MKLINVEIRGTSPLLQHRFSEDAEQQKATRSVVQDRGTPREQATAVCYKNDRGYYFPSSWIAGSIKEAGGNHKLRGSRKSAKYVVPAAIGVIESDIVINDADGKAVKNFEVDSRPVTIPATKGRVMRHRPRFDDWSARFTLRINDKILPEEFLQQLLTEAGETQGIGDYRPQKFGPFGCFRVTEWKEAA